MNEGFPQQTKGQHICHHKTDTIRNTEGSSSDRRKITSDENVDLHTKKKSTGNGIYVVIYIWGGNWAILNTINFTKGK